MLAWPLPYKSPSLMGETQPLPSENPYQVGETELLFLVASASKELGHQDGNSIKTKLQINKS